MNISANGPDSGFLLSRLERAAQRASDHWLPANPIITNKIRTGLQSGKYEANFESLLEEIKSDLSIFLYCIRESLSLAKESGSLAPKSINPCELLRRTGAKHLQLILERATKRISTHTLLNASEQQQMRLKEVMISASTAEALAPSQSINPEAGFSAAVLRQLGMALIAWNYPTVYQRALERSDSTLSLESAIQDLLGFSPTLFGSFILGRWGLDIEMRSVVGRDPVSAELRSMSQHNLLLKKICEVGEALARAQHPEYYSNAEVDWDMANKAIQVALGADGMQVVQRHIRDNCEQYRISLKAVFSDTTEINPAAKISAFKELKALDRNPYIKGCQASLKQGLRELYSTMERQAISQHAVRVLTRELFPIAGFIGGCVYILDPASRQFAPRLSVGRVTLRTISPVSYSHYAIENDSVIRAFDCQAPIVEHSRSNTPDAVASISAALGSTNKIGVLYLEVPQLELNHFSQSVQTHFKAVRKALEDALNLS